MLRQISSDKYYVPDWYQYKVYYWLLDDGVGTKTGRRTKAKAKQTKALKILEYLIIDCYQFQVFYRLLDDDEKLLSSVFINNLKLDYFTST